MTTEITVKKKFSELYEVRHGERGAKWADFNLVCGTESVRITINSDYGNYAYIWSSCGCNPKKFLTGIDFYYAMKNLTKYKVHIEDPDGLPSKLKQQIIELRKIDELTKDRARVIWNEMTKIKPYDYREYQEQLWNHEFSSELFFGDPSNLPTAQKVDPTVEMFWDNCWIPFVEQLKVELSQESN